MNDRNIPGQICAPSYSNEMMMAGNYAERCGASKKLADLIKEAALLEQFVSH